jgi:hypothetical protein
LSHRRLRAIASRLDASQGAPGPRDFAVRIDIARPATPTRPSHPAPNTRDDREAPLFAGTERRELVEMICPTGIAEYFCDKDWTTQISLNPLTKLPCPRSRVAARLKRASTAAAKQMRLIGPSGKSTVEVKT